ncbi:hypothetical protein V8G54_008166 [Vigna mungo]|uniref:Eukaryotic translation initiation factor 3 subunit L n=1 Tax=Vigna mungo TaxID=3915 RepID=A0AAQ3S654_VIGMU
MANQDYEERPQTQELGYDPNFVPDSVKSFVVHLYRHIREKNVYEIHQMYESSFQTLSERLFKDTPWPSVDAVAHYVDNDHVFCLLYREMWFRHLYARLTPTLRQRIDSWDNYCSLFQVVLHGVVNMQLPNQWLWDMVDEFVYQFQSFCQYRAKMKNKTEQEIALLRQFDQAWNVYGVLNFLQALVEKSTIIQILEQEKEGLEQFTATDGYDYNGGSNVLKVLGYFSMVGLLRVHCLLGDYHTGIKCLLPIDISQQGVYTSVIGSHITTIYHYGFANLMLRSECLWSLLVKDSEWTLPSKDSNPFQALYPDLINYLFYRYVEAIREFNKILLYIFKTKQYHQKSPQYEQILKKNEQMYALLAICLSLCPQTRLVDETVNSQLREKYGEKMARMQRYDDEAFAIYDELFSYACPKFITPSAPSFEEPLVNYNQDAYRLQLKLFLYEAKQQQLLSGVRTFLKVYSTISFAKLASYMEVDEPTLRTILITYKHKTHAVDSDGKITSNADVDFYIDEVQVLALTTICITESVDTIHVVESKPAKRYGDYFLRQIVKLEGVINEMDVHMIFSLKEFNSGSSPVSKIVRANVEHSFNLLQDTIHVVESKPAKPYGDYFLRQIVKLSYYVNYFSLCSSLPLSSTSIFLNILCSPKPLVFFMGVSSNPKVFLSDKDLKGANFVDPELGLLVPNEGCQIFIQEDHHLFKLKHLSVQERHQQQQDNKDRH